MRKTLNEKLKYFIKPGELLSMGKGAVKNIHINKKERKATHHWTRNSNARATSYENVTPIA